MIIEIRRRSEREGVAERVMLVKMREENRLQLAMQLIGSVTRGKLEDALGLDTESFLAALRAILDR